jgi:quercetin dioxygenase-like cupin family protein
MEYVFSSSKFKRYTFPTHINDLIIDRADAAASEVFLVVLRPGQATHLHAHDDTEQIFYVLEGTGTLTVEDAGKEFALSPGDFARIPPSTPHTVRNQGASDLRYISIDCFCTKHNEEKTWDDHVKTMCRQQGWNYDVVTGQTRARRSPDS